MQKFGAYLRKLRERHSPEGASYLARRSFRFLGLFLLLFLVATLLYATAIRTDVLKVGDVWEHQMTDASLTVIRVNGNVVNLGIRIDGSDVMSVIIDREELVRVISSGDYVNTSLR